MYSIKISGFDNGIADIGFVGQEDHGRARHVCVAHALLVCQPPLIHGLHFC
jgi:hypothetical protein